MTFADWKKKSKVFGMLKERAERCGIGFQEGCQAAYKAGERQGRKDIEDLATRAAVLRDLVRPCGGICAGKVRDGLECRPGRCAVRDAQRLT